MRAVHYSAPVTSTCSQTPRRPPEGGREKREKRRVGVYRLGRAYIVPPSVVMRTQDFDCYICATAASRVAAVFSDKRLAAV